MKNCEDSKTFEQAGYGIRADSFADIQIVIFLKNKEAKALRVPSSSGRE